MTASSDRPSRRKKIVRLTIFALLCLIVIGYGGYTAGWVYFVTLPARHTVCCVTPGDWGAAYEDVTIPGQDGIALAGWYLPAQNGAAVIVLHGYGADRGQMWPHVGYLSDAGYGVLALDMRAHGESEGDHRTWGWQDAGDMQGAVDFLLAQGVERIGILGHSVGGQVALRAAAQIATIGAVVADGPATAREEDVLYATSFRTVLWYANYSLQNHLMALWLDIPLAESVTDSMRKLNGRPVLLIAGGGNPYEAEIAQKYVGAARDPKTLWIIPEAGHGETWKVRPDDYAARVIAFFDAALLETRSPS